MEEVVRTNKSLGDDVTEDILEYFKKYPVEGYGTEFKYLIFNELEGYIKLVFNRLESCD